MLECNGSFSHSRKVVRTIKKGPFALKNLFKILICAFFLYAIFVIFSKINKIREKKEKLAQVNAQIRSWEEKNAKLDSETQLNDESVEKAARENLGMCKEGEKIFVISSKESCESG